MIGISLQIILIRPSCRTEPAFCGRPETGNDRLSTMKLPKKRQLQTLGKERPQRHSILFSVFCRDGLQPKLSAEKEEEKIGRP